MGVYYNEHDLFAAAWLRELILAGHIPAGVVDERSIEDIRPDELAGFTQCHFFAGIGGWAFALRCAGWPDDLPAWTGSCPCQPFSAAGKGGGFADERHLWPAFHWLIEQCRPDIVIGEQVEGSAGRAWLDLVQTDLEGIGYASGAVVFPAASIGAPHMRHRTYWMAHALSARRAEWRPGAGGGQTAGSGFVDELAHANDARSQGRAGVPECPDQCAAGASGGGTGELADTECRPAKPVRHDMGSEARGAEVEAHQRERLRPESWAGRDLGWPGPTNGFWRDADWLYCRDGKWRPVESGSFPLAHGVPARVGRLRGYGNAVCIPQAVAVIEAIMSEL